MVDVQAFHRWIADFATAIAEQNETLTELDRAIGDGDHGTNMHRGMQACAQIAAEDFADVGSYLKKVGMTLVGTVGGAAGPLYGTFFLRMAGPLQDKPEADAQVLAEALRSGVDGMIARGRAEPQDKTMYDAWKPALEAYEADLASGGDLNSALQAAAQAARDGRDATEDLVARKGRASYLGDRSRGHIDPGAASTVLLLTSAASQLSS